jgi:hypothetical protein
MATKKVKAACLASIYFDHHQNRDADPTHGSEVSILSGIRMIGTILQNWAFDN